MTRDEIDKGVSAWRKRNGIKQRAVVDEV
jgi:hypothetical protein